MTVSLVGQSGEIAGVGTTPTFTLPGTVAEGDACTILVVKGTGPATGGTVTSAGYTLIWQSNTNNPNAKVYIKLLGAAETTVDVDGGSNQDTTYLIDIRRSDVGFDPGGIDGTGIVTNQTNSRFVEPDELTTSGDDRYRLFGGMWKAVNELPVTYPGDWEDPFGTTCAGGPGNDQNAIIIGGKAAPTAGADTPGAAERATARDRWAFHFAIVENPPSSDSIGLTDITQDRIVQRAQDLKGNPNISGPYSGTTPITSIEYRVVDHGTDNEVVPWTVGDASPSGGTYAFPVLGVPSGGPYNVDVRSMDGVAVVAQRGGLNAWDVGELAAFGGQSQVAKLFTDGQTLTSNVGVRRYSALTGWTIDIGGDGGRQLGNILNDVLGCAIGLLDYGVGGSGLDSTAGGSNGYWLDTTPGEPRDEFLTGVSDSTQGDNQIAAFVWSQGTADAYVNVNTATYFANLGTFLDNVTTGIRALVAGRNNSGSETLPVVFVYTGRETGQPDADWQEIHVAQIDYMNGDADSYQCNEWGYALADGTHLTNAAYILFGQDLATTILYYLGILTDPAQNPVVTGATGNDGSATITLTFDQDINLADTVMSLEGWRVTESATPATISSVTRTGNRTVSIVLAAPVTTLANVLVTGKYGVGGTNGALVEPRATDKTLPGSSEVPSPLFAPFYDMVPTEAATASPLIGMTQPIGPRNLTGGGGLAL